MLYAAEFATADLEFFEKKIRPLLSQNCFKCPSAKAKKLKGGLRLDYRAGILKGGDSGPAVRSGKPDMSRLVEASNYDNVDLEMPPSGKLNATQITDLTEWVKRGLPWPKETVAVGGAHKEFDLAQRQAAHWAWQPVKKQLPPKVKQVDWPASPLDNFILAKLEAAKLKPARQADKRTLIRRAYFDLIGIPPTPEQIDSYMKDNSPEAFTKVVDGLLASPHFGERWGRHWLDLMRFAETNGYERDSKKDLIWRYRDYVIDAFNEDKPYDRFIMEQLAGDELPDKDGASITATGFYRLGIWDDEPADRPLARYNYLDDILRTTAETFLGMTVGCARCHDHKIDPIPQKDYY